MGFTVAMAATPHRGVGHIVYKHYIYTNCRSNYQFKTVPEDSQLEESNDPLAEGKILSKTCSAPRGKGMPVLDPELVLRLSLLPTNTSAIEKHRMHHVTTLFIQQKYASVIPFPMVLARKLNFSKENVLDDLYQFPNWTIINKTVHYCSRLNICKLNKLIYKFQIHKMNCQTKIVSCMLH